MGARRLTLSISRQISRSILGWIAKTRPGIGRSCTKESGSFRFANLPANTVSPMLVRPKSAGSLKSHFHLMEGIGLALDLKGGRMFITDFGGSVDSANLDGSNRRTLLVAEGNLTGIAYAEVPSAERGGASRVIGVPQETNMEILLPGSCVCRRNYGAGWSAYVHQRRSSRRKPHGAALRRGDCRTASLGAGFKLRHW
jgi:hypothetical protein